MSAGAWLASGVVAVLVAVHLVAEARGAPAARALSKVGASLAFVAVALAQGVDGPFDRGVLAALALSVAGDAFLLSGRRGPFLAGLGAFLLAHVAYAVAFAGVSAPSPWAALPLGAAFLAVVRWLWPHAKGLRSPVVAYGLVISAMVWLALGTGRPVVLAGAALFYLSDLTVARDRFVTPGLPNRLLGIPLYYVAQVLLASSVG